MITFEPFHTKPTKGFSYFEEAEEKPLFFPHHMDCRTVSSVFVRMDRLDQARELMAEATAFLEDACTAAVEGQSAASTSDIHETAKRMITLANSALSAAQSATELFTE